MTPTEIVETAFKIDIGCVPLSLAAVYAILGDKFIRPTIDRADTVTSSLRGEVSASLADAVRPFVATQSAQVVRIALVGAGGEPLDRADISGAPSVDSESFRDAIRGCLDGRSDAFDAYWYSTIIAKRMKLMFRLIRFTLCVWPAITIVHAAYFGMLQRGEIELPNLYWLWGTAWLSLLPLAVFSGVMPILSHSASCIDKLEK